MGVILDSSEIIALERSRGAVEELVAGREQEQFDVRLIEQREGLVEGDLRAEIAAHLIGTLARVATGEFLRPGNSDPFPALFQRRLRAVHDLFLTQTLTWEAHA